MTTNKVIETFYSHMKKGTLEDLEKIKSCGPLEWPQCLNQGYYVGQVMRDGMFILHMKKEMFWPEELINDKENDCISSKCKLSCKKPGFSLNGLVEMFLKNDGNIVFNSWKEMVG